eukprot:TRINITY_DN13052_c0_g1_i6.p1 TRINITY_DN13052_c0_g1~~TRINITY_DN13052_c0_g1_i6.p1  ORF type:complete len:266 (-),score=0.17 TRINITY_DN13052_c0_g1_i6:20-817(-)
MNVILWGRSLGTGPTVFLASKVEVRGMILHSPLLSALRTQENCFCYLCVCSCIHCPTLCCDLDSFSTFDRIAHVRCPVFIIHGTEDVVVPFSHGQFLQEHFQNAVPPLWVEGAGHNDILALAKDEYMQRATDFISYIYSNRDRRPRNELLPGLKGGRDSSSSESKENVVWSQDRDASFTAVSVSNPDDHGTGRGYVDSSSFVASTSHIPEGKGLDIPHISRAATPKSRGSVDHISYVSHSGGSASLALPLLTAPHQNYRSLDDKV